MIDRCYRYKTIICMVFAFFLLTLTLSAAFSEQDRYPSSRVKEFGKAINENQDFREYHIDASNTWMECILVNEMRTGSSQQIAQTLLWNKSSSPMLKFMYACILVLVALLFNIYALSYRRKNSKISRRYVLYRVMEYLHSLDGKKRYLFI